MKSKLLAFAFLTALAGCSSTGTQSTPATGTSTTPSAPASSGGRSLCDATAVQSVVGETFSDRLAESARSRAKAGTVRVLQPGQVMTLEYNPERLTIVVDESKAVASARCG